MKYIIGLIIILVLGLGTYALTTAINSPKNESGPAVAATIFPIYDITRNVAGNAIEVTLVLPPGASPHTFDPSPSTVRNLQNAQAVYAVGHGFDDWVLPVAENTNTEHVVVDARITLRETGDEHDDDHDDHHDDEHEDHHDDHEDEDDHGHEHGPIDPHYWLTIPNAVMIAHTIASDLTARFPEHATTFETNLLSYIDELTEAEAFVRTEIAKAENPQIITLHDAWYYLAEEYGLEVAGTFEPTAGREPTPFYLAELSEAVEDAGVSIIYSEPQLAVSQLEAFASDLSLTIREIDPIGGGAGQASYIDLMRSNATILSQNR